MNERKGANCRCLFGKGLVGERDLCDAASLSLMPVVTVRGKNAWNLFKIPGFFCTYVNPPLSIWIILLRMG